MKTGSGRLLWSAGLLVLVVALSTRIASSRGDRNRLFTFHHENVLGTSLEMKLHSQDESQADRAQAAGLGEIDRLSKILSAWDPSSEFSRWTRTRNQAVPISPELMEVLRMYDRWQTSTGGVLNASAATAGAMWRAAESNGQAPAAAELREAVQRMQARHWMLDTRTGTATHLDDARLALASFTKSYIADRAADAIMAASDAVDGTIVNIGGDIVVRGSISESVDIRDPRADAENDPNLTHLMVHDAAIATSGSYRRGFDVGGRHYSHIIDPRTAKPADEIISATVEASDPATAGALATAFSVMTPQQSAQLASQFRDVDYLIVKHDGSLYASTAWQHLTMPILASAESGMQVSPAKAAAGDWNPAFELMVNLALARVDDPRYRRPYVAVWIEDKDKFPVRTLALWYEKPRWLPDLKAWYRDDRLRALAEGTEISHSVSSATRPPGRYTLRWDGKDNKGKLVLAGKYTVCVEAAREHGTYQLMRQDMEFTGAPKQAQLPGNTEVESVSLDYRKVSR